MDRKSAPRVIAIEEHYLDCDIGANFAGADTLLPHDLRRRLEDLGVSRLKEMDDAGIDVQVLSHAGPATQRTDAEAAVKLARVANDRLHDIIQLNPKRFAAFATLPTPDPKSAADELERTVADLGFVGGMVNGLTNGRFIDEKQFWPLFERAQALDVPLYMHPAAPHPAVVESYYKDYAEQCPNLLGAACGFTVEAAVQAIRLVLSGVLDAYPRVKIILGHLGEGVPYLLWRIDHALARPGNLAGSFRDCFCEHFYVTTSGNFSNPAMVCCLMELGVDRILFAVDWPFVSNDLGVRWVQDLPLCAEDRQKVLGGNATRLLRV
jgi:2,3-dihydroxybenzoate decarboxylase